MKLSLVNNYLKNGFCIVRNFLDTKDLNLIKSEINKITRNLKFKKRIQISVYNAIDNFELISNQNKHTN
jgi:hypothetical protein